MLGAQLAPWRLWRSGLGRNGTARAASFGLRTNQVTGAQGPQENCDTSTAFQRKLNDPWRVFQSTAHTSAHVPLFSNAAGDNNEYK
jgi:hypothetical protein